MKPTSSESRRTELYALLGDLPDRHRPITAQTLAVERRPEYVLEKLLLDLNGIEPVPAYFVRPLQGNDPFPVVVYNHAHGGVYEIGKDELLEGRRALQKPPYAEELTRNGFAALCIDTWLFGDRRGQVESVLFKHMLWQGQVLWGMMVYDSLRAVDYLVSRPDVIPSRISTMGISMGSTMAWWLAALDTRVKVCVDLCCLTDYQALIETRNLDGHGLYYYVPRLLKHFTAAQINALIAPRAHLSIAGEYDALTPPAGLDRIDAELKQVYAALDAADNWRLIRYPIGHFEPAQMRAEVLRYLKSRL
jgi:dienelactone hydrolase